jgi:uncharacterized protein YecE (DUF72 family)
MLKLGTSGFSYPDWKGTVYPKKLKASEMLEYYEEELGFDACELNYTYYRLPDPRTIERMARRVSREFEFTVKAHKEMTHAIWEDEERKVIKDIKGIKTIFKAFVLGIEPLAARQKLGAILLQFPTFFKHTEQNIEYLGQTREWLKGLPLVIEFRNSEWLEEETYNLMKRDKLGICVVDEPQLPRLLPYEPRATSDLGYFRFHGRNEHWYTAGAHERYNYLYSEKELKEFLPGIKKVAGAAKKTFVFFNNCFMGQSVKNAVMLRDMLGIKFQKRTPNLL